jgi:hypothetical protein
MKKIITLAILLISLNTFATDVFKNGQLYIPSVIVGTRTYTDVVITVRTDTVSVESGPPSDFVDRYDLATGKLKIPSVSVGSTIYTNVTLDLNVNEVVSVGGFYDNVQNNSTSLISAMITVGL